MMEKLFAYNILTVPQIFLLIEKTVHNDVSAIR